MTHTTTQFVRQEVPVRAIGHGERLASWKEVNLTYSWAEAKAEADRCLQCLTPYCEEGCPNHNPIRDFIGLIQEGRPIEAAMLDWFSNPLSACTGRVCAWENQCEGHCVLNNWEHGQPIRVGALERFISDYANAHLDEIDLSVYRGVPRGQSVAVIGAGPAGLAAAYNLVRYGYDVTVYDAWHLPGGVMAYGIPEYVLPQEVIDREVERLKLLGVKFRFRVHVGKDISLQQLRDEFDAVVITIGANKANAAGVPGQDLHGVWTAKDFLMQATETVLNPSHGTPQHHIQVGARVVIVGSGDTAMDAARTALRLGATDVNIVYRRTEEESPSRAIEASHVREEGGKFHYLVNPTRILGDANGHVQAVELVRMKLGEPDKSGRPRPVPDPGSEFIMPCDTVIFAIGYSPETDLAETTPDLAIANWGGVLIDSETGMTSLEGVFAAGDIVTGAKTVIHAVAAARELSEKIHAYLEHKAAAERSERHSKAS